MKNRWTDFWKQVRREKLILLLCFVLAFLAWQGIRRNLGFEVSVSNIAVDVEAPEGWAVWEKSVHRVNILFRGSREDIRYLNNERLRVVIPVANPHQGEERIIRLSAKYLKNPTSAKVVRFSPSEVVVKLDQEGERQLPVKASLSGALPEGQDIERIVCSPASVRVTGAKQVLDEMDNIHTEPITLANRQGPFKESVPIAIPQVGRMRVNPDWVSVEVVLESRNSNAELEDVPVRLLCEPGERRMIRIEPRTIDLTVRGQPQRLEEIRTADIFAYVSCTELVQSTTYELPVVVDLPAGIQMVRTEPAVVQVTIENTTQEF